MSLCTLQPFFEHKFEWISTMDGKGYWRCLNAGCGETMADISEHHGG